MRVEGKELFATFLEFEVFFVVDAAEVFEGFLVVAQVPLLFEVELVQLVFGLRLLEVVPVIPFFLGELLGGLEVLFLDFSQLLFPHPQVLNVLFERLLHSDDVRVVVRLDALLLLLQDEVVKIGALVRQPCRTLPRAFSGESRTL